MSAVVRHLKPVALPLLLITAGMLGLTLLPALPRATAVSFTLFGRIYSSPLGWGLTATTVTSPGPDLTVLPGETVTMTLYSGDGYTHNWGVDYNGNGVPDSGEPLSNSFGSAGTTYTFTATTTPGTYTYWCYIHKGPMVGKFIVQSPPGPDYSVSSNPSSLTIPQGANANSTVSITSLNNFAGSVSLSSSPSSPPGLLTSSFSVNPVMVPAGGTAKSNFTISVPAGTSPASYSITVTAKNSTTFSHSTTVSVTVPTPTFSIVPSPASVTINSGSSGISTLTVTGSNGFSGTVSLATTVPSGRATATLNPTSVMLSPTTTSAMSTLTVSSALGMFNVTVTATSGGTSQSAQVLVNGPDFSITTSPTTVSLAQGSSAILMVTLSGVNGFSGSVALTAFPSTGGPPVTVSPISLQVPSSGSVSATLTVSASSSGAYSTPISPGSYTITLNATMGSLSHTETIPITVTSPSSGVGILTSPIVIGGIAVAIAVVAGIVYVLRRRPKTST
jgi:copper binding plastocyanin/azurin family protein